MNFYETKTYKDHVKYQNRKLVIKTALIVAFIAACLYGMYQFYGNERVVTAKVISINTRMHVSGSDGNTYSTYEYLVTTDRGIFKNQPDGIFYSKVFGNLENGKTYDFTIRGFEMAILGVYPFIIDAQLVLN
jgi:hypothetical protein